MNYQSIADRLVKQGIGEDPVNPLLNGKGIVLMDNGNRWQSVKGFCHDPRTAMAVMKKVADEGFHSSWGSALDGEYDCHVDHVENDERSYSGYEKSLELAIVIAGLSALEGK